MTRLLKGWDNVAGSADDGRLTGYNLSADLAIPDTGRLTSWGRFYVQLLDDPAAAIPGLIGSFERPAAGDLGAASPLFKGA